MLSEQNKALMMENERMKRQRRRFQTNIDLIMSDVIVKDSKINTLINMSNEQSRSDDRIIPGQQREDEEPIRVIPPAEPRTVDEGQTKQDESNTLEEWRRNNS